jgi:erythromycin esterase-like protein
LQNIIDKQFAIVVGDANGADKALQKHLTTLQYPHVTVFCAGNVCRNNLGNWSVKYISVDANITGRAFYTQKDKAMAQLADYGFVLWDGKSPGSFNNVLAFLKQRKKALVYFAPDSAFYPVSSVDDARTLLDKCDPAAVTEIDKKIKLTATLQKLDGMAQNILSFAAPSPDERKQRYYQATRNHNYRASLRLEGLFLPDDIAALPLPATAQGMATLIQQTKDRYAQQA